MTSRMMMSQLLMKDAERSDESQREAIINSSTHWCSCGHCSPCPPKEAVCCHDKPEVQDFMESSRGCITEQTFFQAQLMSEEGLQYNRMLFASIINDHEARKKYLEQVFDNGKRRHLCYRNFLIFMNRGQPIVLLRKFGNDIPILVENTLDLVIQWIICNDLTVRVVLHIKCVSLVCT